MSRAKIVILQILKQTIKVLFVLISVIIWLPPTIWKVGLLTHDSIMDKIIDRDV